jgi:hypothetical protein
MDIFKERTRKLPVELLTSGDLEDCMRLALVHLWSAKPSSTFEVEVAVDFLHHSS